MSVWLLLFTSVLPRALADLAPELAECENVVDQYQCLWKLRDSDNATILKLVMDLPSKEAIKQIFELPGVGVTGAIVTMAVLIVLGIIGNVIGIFFLVRWNNEPLSRKPTEQELDEVLDQDLPVMLINHEERKAEFQFAAKQVKDTQTIMSASVQDSRAGNEQSSMPSELMSAQPGEPSGGGGGGGANETGGRPAGGGGGRGGGGRRGGKRGGRQRP